MSINKKLAIIFPTSDRQRLDLTFEETEENITFSINGNIIFHGEKTDRKIQSQLKEICGELELMTNRMLSVWANNLPKLLK